jgi:hypothetical protein
MRSYSLKWRLVTSLLMVFLCLWSIVFAWLYVDLQKRLQDTLDQRLSASAHMVARLIQQLPMKAIKNELIQQTNKSTDAENLIACEVSLFSSDISVGQHVVAKTRGAPANLSQQQLGFSTWQQSEIEWRSYVLRKNDIQVVAAERMFAPGLRGGSTTLRVRTLTVTPPPPIAFTSYRRVSYQRVTSYECRLSRLVIVADLV